MRGNRRAHADPHPEGERRSRALGLAELEHINHVLQAVRGINRLIVKEKDPDELLRRSAELMVETRGYQNAAFVRLDGERAALPFVAVPHEGARDGVALEPMAELPACMRTAVETKRPLVVNEDREDCRSCPFRDLHKGTTRMVGPLVHEGRRYGVAVIALRRGQRIHPAERELFEEMVSDVAFALHGIALTERERRSQERFQRLYQNMAQGVVYQDGKGRITRCNRAAERVLGLSLAQMQGRTSMDPRWKAIREDGSVYPGEEHPGMLALRSGIPAQGVMGVHSPAAGRYRWLSISAVPELEGPGGAPSGVFTTFEDITAIRHAEAQLREAQNIAGLGRWELDLQTGRLQWSESIYDLFEVDPASFEATYEAFLGFVHPDDRDALDAAYRKSVESREPYTLTHRLRMPDGRVKWVKELGRTSYADDGTPIRSVGTVQDVTDLKMAEQELRERNVFIQTVLDHIPIGLAVSYIDQGTATYMNRAFSEIYGWPADELRDVKRFFDRVYPDFEYRQQIREMVERDLESGDQSRMRWDGVRATGKDGVVRIVDAANIPLYEQNLMISTARDVTAATLQREKIRELEEQYSQAQKMESVGRLAGGVAHDFNNHLSVIIGYAEVVAASLREGDPLRADIQEVEAAGKRAAKLTRQLLAFSRKQVLEPKVLSLNEVIADVEKMLLRLIGADIDVRTVLADDLGNVFADPSQLEQVLMNLAVNARDAMPRGGRLTIETAAVELDEDDASEHPGAVAGPYVMLVVADDGEGMSPETKERLFEPFFTTKEKGRGTGLGLATVYGIVKQSGGTIRVQSELGRGTTFRIYLPRVEGEKTAAIPAPRADRLHGDETVLIVEDDDAVRMLAKRMLLSAGYDVLTAANAGEALLECERQGERIQLVLTDVVMPKMSGQELVHRLERLSPRLRVLYMSGYTDDAVVLRGVLGASTHFIAKPFSAPDLLERVRQVLDAPSPAPRPR